MNSTPGETGSVGGNPRGASPSPGFDARTVERPHEKLWTYYIIVGLLTGPFLVFMLPVLYFRYHTLKYRFDDDGVSMSVGFLFKREVQLTYRRIQDIHVTRGLIQRWLGLATISLQTASGSAGAEMQIEGVLEADALRDWLYARMRGSSLTAAVSDIAGSVPAGAVAASMATAGIQGAASLPAAGGVQGTGSASGAPDWVGSDGAAVLEEILQEVKALRERLEARS